MKPAKVIAAFGGTTNLARAIGAPVTTVHKWKGAGRIPAWRHDAIKAAAEKAGIDLTGKRRAA